MKERQEKETAYNIKVAKHVIGGGELSAEELLRDLYYDMMKEFYGKQYTFKGEMNNRAKAMWTRVRVAQEASGRTPQDYLRAQFAYFKGTFGASPQITTLATDKAVERAREYRSNSRHNIVGRREHKAPKADRFREAEKMLLGVQRAQKMSRSEVYRELVLTGLLAIDKDFLDADPLFKRVAAEEDNG